ncbi:MAG TPA: hypothetical protein VJ600_05650 [Holophagaceae bacterium]|nr:hypothetical protein [Holophagaceae bacterium]
MPTPESPSSRLVQARRLVQEKGLSKQDLSLLDEILRAGELAPMLEAQGGEPGAPFSEDLIALRRSMGLFLAFLNQFSPRRLGEARPAMGLVIEHSLARLGSLAKASHRELLAAQEAPAWVGLLLDLAASLRVMSFSSAAEGGGQTSQNWAAFLSDHAPDFKEVLTSLPRAEDGTNRAAKVLAQMKNLNRALHTGGRAEEAMRKLAELLEAGLPPETRRQVEPLLLVEHVITDLRLTLQRPLDRGIHWPAVAQVQGSLQWLWNHLGWTLPRVEPRDLQRALPPEVRKLLQQLRKEDEQAFRIVARAITSHLAVSGMLEGFPSFVHASVEERHAAVAPFFVVEAELGRMAEQVYTPDMADSLSPGAEAQRLRGLFRQAVLSLRQDQSTVRGLLQQALATQDADQLAATLDNLKTLLHTHQRQLMGDLVGIFSPELRLRLFPESVSLAEEGDRLRQRLHRLYESLSPLQNQLQLHLELQDWPRLALNLANAQQQGQAFRRSPEFPLIRPGDREEAENLIQLLTRTLDNPMDMHRALVEGTELVSELLRFLELLLLRINARAPLIRHDLEIARGALGLCAQLWASDASERARLSQKLLQTAKKLGVRDPQTLVLLKRWVRSERGQKEGGSALDVLSSHLERLSMRLEAALG